MNKSTVVIIEIVSNFARKGQDGYGDRIALVEFADKDEAERFFREMNSRRVWMRTYEKRNGEFELDTQLFAKSEKTERITLTL